MIYAASPYTHQREIVRKFRCAIMQEMAADKILQGIPFYSPIAYTAPIVDFDNPGFEKYRLFDEAMIRTSSKIVVVQIPGWEYSNGVKNEMEYAKTLNKPIEFEQPFGPTWEAVRPFLLDLYFVECNQCG